MKSIRSIVLGLVLLGLPWAAAQDSSLEQLAPTQTVLALGLQGGEIPGADLEQAWQALDMESLGQTLNSIANVLAYTGGSLDVGAPLELTPMAGLDDDFIGDLTNELDATCPGLGAEAEALLSTAWFDDLLLSVAADRFSPLPGVLALARVNDAALASAESLGASLAACFGNDSLGTEGGTELLVLFDGTDLPLVMAQRGSLFILGSQPELVRGALRREAGADEASLASNPATAFTTEGPGARIYWNATGLADVVEALIPIPAGDELEPLVQRGAAIVRTLGQGGARISLTENGVTLEGAFQAIPDGGDPTLYELATCAGCEVDGISVVPAGVTSASAATLRASAWVDWLDEVAGEITSSLGAEITVRGFAEEFLGLDLDAVLLDWLGDEVVTMRLAPISTDLSTLVFGAPTVSVIPVTSESAARSGIETLLGNLTDFAQILDLQDMLGEAAGASDFLIRDTTIAGLPGLRVQAGPTVDLGIVVANGALHIASPSAALGTYLEATGSAESSSAWSEIQRAEGTRIGWSINDPAADLAGIASLLELATQPLASLTQIGLQASLDAYEEASYYDDWGFDPYAPYVNDLAEVFPYEGPEGLLDVFMGDLPLGVPVASELGMISLGEEILDVWVAPDLADGTEAPIVVESFDFDTYLYLFDAVTGEELASNDDLPDTSRSEIVFISDGRPLLVGVTSFSGYDSGAYTLSIDYSNVNGSDESTGTIDEDVAAPEVPSFGELLALFEALPEAVRILADRAGDAWGAVTVEDGVIRQVQQLDLDW